MIYFFQGVLTCFMLAVMIYDTGWFIIPNWLVGVLLLLWPAMLLIIPGAGVDWKMALEVFGISFVVGYTLFALKLMGGGDVKLLAACCLWVGGMPQIMNFLVYTALFGGLLSIALLGLRPLMIYVPIKNLPRVMKKGEPVPYGLAIAAAFMILLWDGMIPGLR